MIKSITSFTLFILILGSCTSMDNDVNNSIYQKKVIKRFDSLLITHFPKKINSGLLNISSRILEDSDSVFADVNRVFVTINADDLDSLMEHYSGISKEVYSEVNNDNVLTPYHFHKVISGSRIFNNGNYKTWKKSKKLEGLVPIPRLIGIVKDQKEERVKRPYIEANTYFYVLESDTISLDEKYEISGIENYMPSKWWHGYSKGVFIDRNKGEIMYWVITW